jgi:hypothetical protein
MKITQQTIKQIINEELENVLLEQQGIQTIGELITMLKAISVIKKGGNILGSLGKVGLKAMSAFLGLADVTAIKDFLSDPQKALDTIVETMGVVGDLKDVLLGTADLGELMTSFTRLPDQDAKKAGYLAMFDIDDTYLTIVDNDLENKIINQLIQNVTAQGAANTNIADLDMNKLFSDALGNIADGRTLQGAAEKKVSDVKKLGKTGVAKKRLAQKFDRSVAE